MARNVIYVNGWSVPVQQPGGGTGYFPYTYASDFSYTDVILGFLIPDGNGNLIGDGSVLPTGSDPNDPLVPYVKAAIKGFQNAGQNALVSVGGSSGWDNAWKNYPNNVQGLGNQILTYVKEFGFNGVDIDYEDSNAFTIMQTYDGIGLLSELTSYLASQLPPGSIITHAPQTPYWYPGQYRAAYQQIWQRVGNLIAWFNNQFYNNTDYDATAQLKIQTYHDIVNITGGPPPQKLLLGAILDPSPNSEGYLTVPVMLNDVINPLKAAYGSQFGGVMAWEWSLDVNWQWTNTIAPQAHAAGPRDQRESWTVNDLATATIMRTKLGSRARPPRVPVSR
jgi:chitinase